MSDFFNSRFSQQEIKAMRKLASDEDGLGTRLMSLLGCVARSVPFAEDALAAWFCARDPATPPRVRYVLMAAVAYFVLPIDAVPDLIPLLGFTDDAAVVAAALTAVAAHLAPEHRNRARETLSNL